MDCGNLLHCSKSVGTVTLLHDPHAPPGPALCRATSAHVQAGPVGGAVAKPTPGSGTWATRSPAHKHWPRLLASTAPPTPPDSSPSCLLVPCKPAARAQARNGVRAPLGRPAPPPPAPPARAARKPGAREYCSAGPGGSTGHAQ
ncbi:hypothetical protein ACRRTK_018327 [Alexandromys fortis]